MLPSCQKIVYYRNGKEISMLTKDSSIPLGLWQYIRYNQPFISEGDTLSLPLPNREVWKTSIVTKVKSEGNVLVVTTRNSVYRIEYIGIDLQKVLTDGEFEGVNSDDDALFPSCEHST